MPSARRHLLALVLLGLAAPLGAQDASPPVEIHGFGSWSYGRTNRNVLLDGSPQGNYASTSMTLNVFRRVGEKLSVVAQGEVDEQSEVELDYAFADYRLDDHLSFHIGKVKHPFGIYTEVFDVGTLRPFLDLPQGFYGPVGFAGESYSGVGLTGNADVGAWTATYDLYGGGVTLHEFSTPEQFYQNGALGDDFDESEHESTRNVIGGRLVLRAPLQGLSFGASSYTGILESSRRTVVAGQVGYRSNRLTLESEVAHHEQSDGEHAIGGYALAAFRLTPEWQVAGQYNDLTSRFAGVSTTTVPSMQQHREVGVVVSRWLTRAFVVKTEYHRVRGNRFALPAPADLAPTVAANELQPITHLARFGAQFTF